MYEICKEEKIQVKMCLYQSKKEGNEQFGKKKNQDIYIQKQEDVFEGGD